eukprot:scaffold87635_cov63-Phaeocystis_antarctica.AAC.2
MFHSGALPTCRRLHANRTVSLSEYRKEIPTENRVGSCGRASFLRPKQEKIRDKSEHATQLTTGNRQVSVAESLAVPGSCLSSTLTLYLCSARRWRDC